jgi:hypothetical protein
VTTPNITSPNVRLVPKELLVEPPADAPKSQTPLAEAALAELLQGGRLGIRDMYKPAAGPLAVISDEAWEAWHEQRHTLYAGYPDDHATVTSWFVEAWERTEDKPAPGWVKAIEFSPSCWDGACWECTDAPELCACGHHRPGGRAPYGPVKPADPLPAVAEFLGIAKPPVVAEPVPEPAAGEAPATDSVTVLQHIAAEQEAAKGPDVTQVIAVTDAPTEAVPVVKEGESDE